MESLVVLPIRLRLPPSRLHSELSRHQALRRPATSRGRISATSRQSIWTAMERMSCSAMAHSERFPVAAVRGLHLVIQPRLAMLRRLHSLLFREATTHSRSSGWGGLQHQREPPLCSCNLMATQDRITILSSREARTQAPSLQQQAAHRYEQETLLARRPRRITRAIWN